MQNWSILPTDFSRDGVKWAKKEEKASIMPTIIEEKRKKAARVGIRRGKTFNYAHQLRWKEQEMGMKRRQGLVYAHNFRRKAKKRLPEWAKKEEKSSIMSTILEERRENQEKKL